MSQAATKMTYELYCLLPEDGKQYEVIDGELFMTSSPRTRHQKIVVRLTEELSRFARENSLGKVFVAPVDVLLERHTILQPDVLFIRKDRLGIVKEDAIEGAPDLAVEVLSPSTFYKDLRKKMTAYSQFGVQEYWIVDPELEIVKIFKLTEQIYGRALELSKENSEILTTNFLPGFRLPVSKIFD